MTIMETRFPESGFETGWEGPGAKMEDQQTPLLNSDKYSNSNSRKTIFETMFFEGEWRGHTF